jgi:hypothetical protein
MDPVSAAAATPDWTAILTAWGPTTGSVIVALAIVGVPVALYVARTLRSGQIESGRLTGRALTENSRAVRLLADGQQATARQIGTLRSAIQAGPAEYALRKMQIMDGGIPPEERESMRRQVEAAREAMIDPAIWRTCDECADSDATRYQARLRDLQERADYSSDEGERRSALDELRRLRAVLGEG